jgi:predicted GNAT family N-acyltransferase
VIEAIVASTRQQREDALSVRIAVFVDEQKIPREVEIDELDETAVHCVGYADGRAVAAGRLVMLPDGRAKIGRMAVLAAHRNRGAGRTIIGLLEREAAARGATLARLSAQARARGFYERAGYAVIGEPYDEVGIPHVAMEKAL